MKVLFVLHDYLPNHAGGSELHTHQLAKAIKARGHEVNVLFTEGHLDRPEGSVTEGVYDGVPTIEVIHHRDYARLEETWGRAFFAEVFREQLERIKPDVVHFHHTAFWGAACIEVAKSFGARVVMTLHDFHLICNNAVLLDENRLCDGGGERGDCSACLPTGIGGDNKASLVAGARARRKLHRRVFRSVDHVISPSHFLLTRFAAVGMGVPEQRRSVILYGYPGTRRALRQRDCSKPLRVVYLGGLYHAKGVHILIDAMRALGGRDRKGRSPIELVVHGHMDWFPSYSDGLQEMAQGLPVTFAGPFRSGDASKVLKDADVLVAPSIWYENRPITISEAYVNGVVPVTSDLGGMAESVSHEVDGLLFSRGDGPGLADTLERLADEAGLWDRLAAARPSLPDLPEVAEAIEAIYSTQAVGGLC